MVGSRVLSRSRTHAALLEMVVNALSNAGRRLALCLPVLGLFVLALQLFVWLPWHIRRTDIANLDWKAYYDAAVNLVMGRPIYGGEFVYPPTFLGFIAPAALMYTHTFQAVWYALVLVSFWAFAAGLTRLAFNRITATRILTVGLVAYATPGMQWLLSYGNADIVVWAILAWSLDAPALVAGAAIKVYPAVGLVAVRRHEIVPAAAIGAALVVISIGMFGVQPFVEWLHAGAMPLPSDPFNPRNASIPIAVLRLLGHHSLDAGDLAFLRVCTLAGVATLWSLTRKWTHELRVATVIFGAQWFMPICWWYRLPLGLVVVAAAIRANRASR